MSFTERIKNVGAVYAAIGRNTLSTLTGGYIQKGPSITSSPASGSLGKLAATVANHPFATAAVYATGGTAAGRTAVGSAIGSLSTRSKAVLAVASLPAVGLVLKNPSTAVEAVISAPSKGVEVGTDLSTLISNPSFGGVATFIKKHPVATVASAVVATSAAVASGSSLANVINNQRNLNATNANTRAIEAGNKIAAGSSPQYSAFGFFEQAKAEAAKAQKALDAQTKLAPSGGTSNGLVSNGTSGSGVPGGAILPAAQAASNAAKKTSSSRKKQRNIRNPALGALNGFVKNSRYRGRRYGAYWHRSFRVDETLKLAQSY